MRSKAATMADSHPFPRVLTSVPKGVTLRRRSTASTATKKPTTNTCTQKKWSFGETSALMSIWSMADCTRFVTKLQMHRHIQRGLSVRGYERTTNQIRSKLQRLTANTSFNSSTSSADVTANQLADQLMDDKNRIVCVGIDATTDEDTIVTTDDDDDYDEDTTSTESEYDIGYEIKLTDNESDEDSLDKCFKEPIIKDPTPSHANDNCVVNKTCQQIVIDGMKDVTKDLKESFDDIISGSKEFNKSIARFSRQLNRISDHLVVNEDVNKEINKKFDKFMTNTSDWSPSTSGDLKPTMKLILPDINKTF